MKGRILDRRAKRSAQSVSVWRSVLAARSFQSAPRSSPGCSAPADVLLNRADPDPQGFAFSYGKFGKFRHKDLMLSLHSWRGGERVLDVGCERACWLPERPGTWI